MYAALLTLGQALKHFLFDELYLYVFLCSENNLHTASVVMHISEEKEKPLLAFSQFIYLAVKQCDLATTNHIPTI